MFKRHFIIVLLALFTSICHGVEPGVSRELAQKRTAEISDVVYNLHFDLPQERNMPVQGDTEISFMLTVPGDVVLDFKAPKDAVHRVLLNGKTVRYDYADEHIILKDVKAGKHRVQVGFRPTDQSLNRRDDYLYTLLVPDRARTLFPCFDQPDMKAVYNLSLTVPQLWEAVSNGVVVDSKSVNGRRQIKFASTEPLSTYLFAFAAGKFQQKKYDDGHHQFACYYRETDHKKVAQIDTVCRQVARALDWQEKYTGIPYPFAKYDFVILPGFQFGGMEHAGATFYNDQRIFLPPHATPDQELNRAQLIAHETSHMWFGDLVTMRWFDDVWTKEVFANYFAEQIVPGDHRFALQREYGVPALEQDRTAGNTSIRQELDNLQDAGLVYNNIIYNKAPIVMDKIVELMGEDAFREGIRKYLQKFSYNNATWDELIEILDSKTPVDLADFSLAWIYGKGMPRVNMTEVDGALRFTTDKVFPQTFTVLIDGVEHKVDIHDNITEVQISKEAKTIVPGADGRFYGLLTMAPERLNSLLQTWPTIEDDVARLATVMNLNENYRAVNIEPDVWGRAILNGLSVERNARIASLVLNYLDDVLLFSDGTIEAALFEISRTHALPSVRQNALRLLCYRHKLPESTKILYDIWQTESEPLLSEIDYTNMAIQLALRLPMQEQTILTEQRSRIKDPDRLARFDYISRAATMDTVRTDALFCELLTPQGRRTEPWAKSALSLLTHPMRGQQATRYITRGLDALPDVQRTGDIFMPTNWCAALLGTQTTPEAKHIINTWLNSHKDMKPLLRNKILQAIR